MGMYFFNLPGHEKFKLNLLITSPKCSARFADGGGPLEEGDIFHILHADRTLEGGLRLCVFSVDYFGKKYWGPYSCGSSWNPMLESYEVSDLIHIHGYRKTVMGDTRLQQTDQILLQNNLTNFITGLPFDEMKMVWDLLNHARMDRISNRVLHPRKDRDQKLEDDIVDVSLSRMIARVNACMNEQLFWGTPIDNHYYIRFSPRLEVFSENLQESKR